jgi:hypothetical protein
MRRQILILLAMAGALLISGTASAMIINGGFEDPDIPFNTFAIFPSITGWTASTGSIEIQDNIAGSPFEGDQFVELDAFFPSVIFQNVGGLIVGQTYDLSFALSARGATSVALDNVLSVSWDGTNVFNDQAATINPEWTVHSVIVTASATSNVLEFADASPNEKFGLGVYIDDVQLARVAVPEPTTLALLGLSLMGLGFARRRPH